MGKMSIYKETIARVTKAHVSGLFLSRINKTDQMAPVNVTCVTVASQFCVFLIDQCNGLTFPFNSAHE